MGKPLDAELDAVAVKLDEIRTILYGAMAELVLKSDNWRETIADIRDDISQRVADITCGGDFSGDIEASRVLVHKLVQDLFDETQILIDDWALRVMVSEPSSSGGRNLH